MLGSRLIDSTAQSLAGQFFTKFSALMKSQSKDVVAKVTKAKPKPVAKKKAVKKKAAQKASAKKAAKKAIKKR